MPAEVDEPGTPIERRTEWLVCQSACAVAAMLDAGARGSLSPSSLCYSVQPSNRQRTMHTSDSLDAAFIAAGFEPRPLFLRPSGIVSGFGVALLLIRFSVRLDVVSRCGSVVEFWGTIAMLEPTRRSVHRVDRLLPRLSLAACALCAALFAGCGARSAVDLLEGTPAGGTGNGANLPDAGVPAGGSVAAGAPAFAGAPAQGGAPVMPPPACEAVTVAIDELRPALTLVVDQSFSMSFRYPDKNSPVTRWALVGAALFDPEFGVVKQFEASVRFGISFFTSRGAVCPILNQVQARTRNYGALNMLYQSLAPEGDTPTGEALQQITSELEGSRGQGPRSILLVTDGDPDTCAQRNPDEGQPQAVEAVQRAFESGIDLYVLGISNGIAGHNLQQLANAGKGRPIDLVWGVDADAAEPFQASGNVQGLATQLTELLNRIPLCEVRLQRDVAPSELGSAQVLLDGQPLRYSGLDGYVLKDPRHLAIVGKSCETIKAGGQQLSVRISCD
jgi:hypothetical protein